MLRCCAVRVCVLGTTADGQKSECVYDSLSLHLISFLPLFPSSPLLVFLRRASIALAMEYEAELAHAIQTKAE